MNLGKNMYKYFSESVFGKTIPVNRKQRYIQFATNEKEEIGLPL